MNPLLVAVQAWARRARWRLAFLHLGEGALVWLAGLGAAWLAGGDYRAALAAGAVAVPAFYYARKMIEVRFRTTMTGSPLDATNMGFFPWDWARVDPWLVVDWALPTAAAFVAWAALA